MQTQFGRQCNEALHAQSLKGLPCKVVEFSEDKGFGRISATVLTEHSPTLREYQFITDAASDSLPEFEDFEAARVDPLSQYVAVQSGPLVWDQSAHVSSGQGELWERQTPYGCRSGIVLGLHLQRGRHLLFGPDCDRPTYTTPTHARQAVEDFHVFAAHAQAAAFELCLSYEPPAHEPVDATPRRIRGAALGDGRDDGLRDRPQVGFVGARCDFAASAGDGQVGMRYQVRGSSQGDQAGLDRRPLNRHLTLAASLQGSGTRA